MAGCGSDQLPVYPVTGSVRFSDGSPLRTGFIEFYPAAAGPSARGPIQSDGSFTLGTFEAEDGAPAGDYRVLVTQTLPPITPEDARKLGPEHEDHASNVQVVSLKYASSRSSDLNCTVSPSSDNRFEFVVESQ